MTAAQATKTTLQAIATKHGDAAGVWAFNEAIAEMAKIAGTPEVLAFALATEAGQKRLNAYLQISLKALDEVRAA